MNISTMIKSVLVEKSLKQQDLQELLGLSSKQAVSNKFANNRWSAEDLAKVANFLDGQLILKVADREIEITQAHFE